jgi:outer membrane cobalamin receptor
MATVLLHRGASRARERGLNASDTARAHFMLMPAAHALDTVAVVADVASLETRLREFLRRSTSSPSGYFLTREDVERRRPADVGGLLQTVSGVFVQRAVPGPTFVRSRRSSDSRCAGGMLIFVDGVLVNSPAAIAASAVRLAVPRPSRSPAPSTRRHSST